MPETITFQHYAVLVRDDGTPWELGRGAMGVTYKALDTNLRVPVALKVIHPRQLDSELVAQRFVREARAAARLRHPHIAAVYHLGQEGENWFYAMEFVDGDTAEALVKREGSLPEPTVLTLAIQAARALNAAAALGLVHRDIKPSNLMLTRDSDEWQLKVIDFGLARTFKGDETDEDLAAVTHSGFVGTPYYASPEQLEQHELDIRSDIYSLGVTLWFLLTGRVPFTGSVVSVLSQHLHKAPPFEQLDGVVSPATRQILERMLAKDPAARPQSARELRHELEHCEGELPGTQARAERKSATATPPQPSVAETAETMLAPAGVEPEARFTPGESHFDAADTVAEFGFGQLCRARERTTGAEFAILRLGAQRELDDASLAHLQETIGRARQIEHEQVWKVHALESDAAGLRIVMAWSEGYPWRELLRRRRELEPDAAFPLLAQAAHGIDAILAAQIDQPDVTLAGLWCEAPAPEAPPTNVKVSPLGVLRTLSNDATWVGDGTLAGGTASPVTGVSGAVRSLAEVAYETLGGSTAAPGYPPLPALSEAANKVLRTALRDPAQFPTATALIEQIIRGQTEAAPGLIFRTPSPSIAQPPVAAESEPPFANATPAPIGDWLPPQPPARWRGLAIAAALAVIAGGAWFVSHRPDESAREPQQTAAEIPEPATPKPILVAATPAPLVIAKFPPAPLPPAPTRQETARMMQQQAAEFRTDRKWKEAAQRLLAMRDSFPDFASAADVDLELLFRDLRWHYTRYREGPPDLMPADVEALRPELEKAEGAGIIGARMLLGEHLSTRKDWPKAIECYEKARAQAPKATTRIGLLYAHYSLDPLELAKAWQYLQAAHQAGDLDGKVAVAECLIHGTFGGTEDGKLVPGLKADRQKGVKLLREIIATAPSRREPPELKDEKLTETYVSEPNRSKLTLANYYYNQEKPGATPPDWYRSEKATIDHVSEMRRMLEEARQDWSDAYGLLGLVAVQGLGEKPNRAAAKAYFEQGVAMNNVLSIFNYAVFLAKAAPSGKIPDEARKLFREAAEKGHEGAMKLCAEQKIPFTRPLPP